MLNGQLKTRLSNETEIYLSNQTSVQTCFIAQETSDYLMKGLTGRQIVMYASKIKNIFPSVNHEEITNKWLQELDILSTSNTPVEKCSGGERKRLAVALELTALNMPNLLCLDEPTSGLDSHSAEVVMSTLKRVASNHPLTIVTSIHQPTTEILSQFDQLSILARGGVCIYNGTPSQLHISLNQVPELLKSTSSTTSSIELLIRQSCAAWPNELTVKLNQITLNFSKSKKLFPDTYFTIDGVVTNRNRFSFHSVLKLSDRYFQYIRSYLWKEWIAYIFVCFMLAVNLRLLFSTKMIYTSGCINIEEDDFNSCQKSFEKLHDELMLNDNLMYLFYACNIFFILPLFYSAIRLYQELSLVENEHRNGKRLQYLNQFLTINFKCMFLGFYSPAAYLLMRSLFEMIPLMISNVFYVCLINIYETIVQSNVYFSFWLILTLAQLGISALGQCITLISGPNFSLTVVVLAGTFIFTMVIGGALVPFSQMHYIYRLLSTFSIPRFAFHLPILLQYGFGRCQEKEVNLALYMFDLTDADYLPSIGMLLMNLVIFRLLSLYLLIRHVNTLENRMKRNARIVQHQKNMISNNLISWNIF